MASGDTSLLGAEELLKQYRLPRELPSRRTVNTNTAVRTDEEMVWDEEEETDAVTLNERHVLNTEARVDKERQLVYGEWVDDSCLVRIEKPKGKLFQYRGFRQGPAQLLYLEEALYMVEQRALMVTHGGLPLTIEQLYGAVCLRGSLLEFQVYAHLSRLGYLVRRFYPDRRCNLPSRAAQQPSTSGQRPATSSSTEAQLEQRPRRRKNKNSAKNAEGTPTSETVCDKLSMETDGVVPPHFESTKPAQQASNPPAERPSREYWLNVASDWPIPARIAPSVHQPIHNASQSPLKPPSNDCANWTEWRAARDAYERNQAQHRARRFAKGAAVDARRTSMWSIANSMLLKISYEAWKPSMQNSPEPSYRICITNANAPLPSFGELVELVRANAAAPHSRASTTYPELLIAVVDQADVNFYTIDNFRVPTMNR